MSITYIAQKGKPARISGEFQFMLFLLQLYGMTAVNIGPDHYQAKRGILQDYAQKNEELIRNAVFSKKKLQNGKNN